MSPMLYYAQHLLNVPAGAELTASHNDNGWTGLKLADGLSSTLGPEGIAKFKEIVKGGNFATGAGRYETVEGVFDEYLKDIVRKQPLKTPVDVVVAAGNGTAGCFAPAVLRALGCNVVEQHCRLDWTFPNFNPNPEEHAFLQDIRAETKSRHAKIGIGIDGDGDRIGVVDDTDDEVFSDKVALLVARWISKHTPGRTIVIDVKSTGLFSTDPELKKNGMKVEMVPTGHSYVKAAVARLDAVAGLERSGHWFFSEPYGLGYDDAVRAAALLLRMLDEEGESLHSLLAKLPKTYQSLTVQATCPDAVKYKVVEAVTDLYRQDLEDGVAIAGAKIEELITVNGVRFVLRDGGWGLIRASSNLPRIVLVVESPNSHEQAVELMTHIKSRLEATGQTGDYDQQWP
jgi:phosphomannomutase/phosphoglucomutase